MSILGAMTAREAHNTVISDAVRLLEDPEIRAAIDRHPGLSFDAGSVVSRLMSTYVDAVNADDAVAELIEAATHVLYSRGGNEIVGHDKNGHPLSQAGVDRWRLREVLAKFPPTPGSEAKS